MNSTEWEIALHLQDFDEFWMQYALGKGSDMKIQNSRFQDAISLSIVLRNNKEISIISKISNFYVIVIGIQNGCLKTAALVDPSITRVYSFFINLALYDHI